MTLIPARVTLSIWENTTWRKTLTVLSADAGSPARDLTGYSAIMTIRTAPDSTPVYTLSTANGQIVLGGVLGTIALYIPASDTATFDSWGAAGIHELVITASGGSGDSDALIWGPVRVLGVT